MTYADADVIKGLCTFKAEDGDLARLRPFISDKFPGIPNEQLDRCMAVAFPGPSSDPAADAEVTRAVNDPLSATGFSSFLELMQAGGEGAPEVAAELKAIAEQAKPVKGN